MIATVYAVFADQAEAERVAEIVVEERLAACANILGPCRSIYRWEGKIERANEVPALFKTVQAEALIARIAELHSYDLPAAVAWPINSVPDRLRSWIESGSDAPSIRNAPANRSRASEHVPKQDEPSGSG